MRSTVRRGMVSDRTLMLLVGIMIGAILTGSAWAAIGPNGIARNAVRTKHIKNGQVKSADIAANGVTTSDIATSGVTSSDIATGTIVSSDIGDGEVVADDIATGAVTGQKLGMPIGAIGGFQSIQSIPDAFVTIADISASNFDSGGLIDLSTDTITIQVAGIYEVCASSSFDFDATGVREMGIYINGSAETADERPPMSVGGTFMTSCFTKTLAVNDAILVKYYHTAGNALNTFGGQLSVMRLGAAT